MLCVYTVQVSFWQFYEAWSSDPHPLVEDGINMFWHELIRSNEFRLQLISGTAEQCAQKYEQISWRRDFDITVRHGLGCASCGENFMNLKIYIERKTKRKCSEGWGQGFDSKIKGIPH